MRKYWKVGIFSVAAALVLAGCSGAGTTSGKTQTETETGAPEEAGQKSGKSSVTLGEYKGVPVKKAKVEVKDDEVEEQIQNLLDYYPSFTEVNRPAKNGDTVDIEFRGLLDGEAFEGGTGQSDLELGSGSFIEGFEEGLIGVKKGEQRDLNLTFPENYHSKDLAGKAVVFEVKVNAVKEPAEPELTDQFVRDNFPEEGSADQLRASMRESLEEQKRQNADAQLQQDIVNAVISKATITCSEEDLEKQYNEMLESYTNEASMYGYDLETYASFYGLDEEGFKSELRVISEENMKMRLVIEAIAEAENIVVEDADRDALAEEQGYFKSGAELAEVVGQEKVDEAALVRKVVQFLIDNAKIEEAEAGALIEPVEESWDIFEDGIPMENEAGDGESQAKHLPDYLVID